MARHSGKVRVSCPWVGIDALNYVGDVFTVAVFDADVFDSIFDGMVDSLVPQRLLHGNPENLADARWAGWTASRR